MSDKDKPRTCKESIDMLQGGRDERRCLLGMKDCDINHMIEDKLCRQPPEPPQVNSCSGTEYHNPNCGGICKPLDAYPDQPPAPEQTCPRCGGNADKYNCPECLPDQPPASVERDHDPERDDWVDKPVTDKTVEQRAREWAHCQGLLQPGAKFKLVGEVCAYYHDKMPEFHTSECNAIVNTYEYAAADTKRRALELVPDVCLGDITANPYMDNPCEPDDHDPICPRAIRAAIEKL